VSREVLIENKTTSVREQMDRIYRQVPLEEIPWNLSDPPQVLVDAIETGRISPCKTVDLGCGAGNHALWLAKQGFDVTGLDISREAINIAIEGATRDGVNCSFEVVDIVSSIESLVTDFDFVYEWEVLHHIFPDDRPRYLRNVRALLSTGATYLSVCFNENDPAFGGEGEYRVTPLGTTLYFSSMDELEKLFSTLFKIEDLYTVEVPSKYGSHIVNIAWTTCPD
jgi:2-polyprenyl-3-methyl-5-hydroxy-6-metoxy-1,4-benzoquinol methylase